MKNKLIFYSAEDHLKESLKDPKFKKSWEESELEYNLAKQMIEKRIARKMSQRQLAKKAKTTQAVISQIETMQANPSLAFLKKIAQVLGTRLTLQFK
jgi:ribosome-binding protein aMBF1 (putative translation factor)